jgi:hypothetical protein
MSQIKKENTRDDKGVHYASIAGTVNVADVVTQQSIAMPEANVQGSCFQRIYKRCVNGPWVEGMDSILLHISKVEAEVRKWTA